jgi:hypothetical protein
MRTLVLFALVLGLACSGGCSPRRVTGTATMVGITNRPLRTAEPPATIDRREGRSAAEIQPANKATAGAHSGRRPEAIGSIGRVSTRGSAPAGTSGLNEPATLDVPPSPTDSALSRSASPTSASAQPVVATASPGQRHDIWQSIVQSVSIVLLIVVAAMIARRWW